MQSNLALLAQKYFKKDLPEGKMWTVGSNLILLGQKLTVQPRFLILKYKEGIERRKTEIERLVPQYSLSYLYNLEDYVKDAVWYPH